MININKKIDSIIKERKHQAENIADENLLLARKNIDFSNLERERNALIIQIAKEELENKETNELKQKLEKINKKMTFLLQKLNLNIIPSYFCLKCNDTGYCDDEVCVCRKKLLNELIRKESGLLNCDYSFKKTMPLQAEEKILFDTLFKWCEKFPNVKTKTVFLTGEIGVGKTFVCSAMANKLIEENYIVYYTTAFNLNNKFIEFCRTSNKEILDILINADALFIDDFGTEPILSNITKNYLYLILNERLILSKPTVINSNLMPDEILTRYGERIFSRIMNKSTGLVLCYKGKDKRINK